jgi:hypothetical protein
MDNNYQVIRLINGTTITSDDASEYVSTQESDGNGNDRIELVGDGVAIFICPANTVTKEMKSETLNTSANLITTRLPSSTIIATKSQQQSLCRYWGSYVAHVSVSDGSFGGSLQTGVIKIT